MGEGIEEMEYADLMKPGSDSEDSGLELFELDLNEILKIHGTAKEDLGTIPGTHFQGHFLNNAWEIML